MVNLIGNCVANGYFYFKYIPINYDIFKTANDKEFITANGCKFLVKEA